jgi:hypothetical protein
MRFCILIALTVVALAALEDPSAKLADIQTEAEAKTAALARAWLSKARLTPVALPAVNPVDARPSEARSLADARAINECLRQARERLAQGKECSDRDMAGALTPGLIRAVIAAQTMPAAKAQASAQAGNR